jgi:hypothetical protein
MAGHITSVSPVAPKIETILVVAVVDSLQVRLCSLDDQAFTVFQLGLLSRTKDFGPAFAHKDLESPVFVDADSVEAFLFDFDCCEGGLDAEPFGLIKAENHIANR